MAATVLARAGGLLLALIVAFVLVVTPAALDGYLGRGGLWGQATAGLTPTPHDLGANTFLHLEVERANVDRTVAMLREAGIGYVRQQFAWNEIEPRPGSFIDDATGRSTWEKYDYIVAALAGANIRVLARVENTPVWARPGEDTTAYPFGPPADYDHYAAFVSQVVARYRGTVTAVQVWNEPNLRHEWGGRTPDPRAYVDLLRRTHTAVRAVEPSVMVIAAGLAPTDGLDPGGANDLFYLEEMYRAGARGAFDALGVMVYGLGQSPDDRRTGARGPINFSRPVLTREVMERHGDAATPVWATEYGWVAVPPDWQGRPSTWGPSVSEEEQARYLMRGLERARAEWPWMGPMMVWAFRFVEGTMDPADPQRHFAIVRHDFSPRPAYHALARRPSRELATAGAHAITDGLIRRQGRWLPQRLGGRDYWLANPDAGFQVDFDGDRVSLLARRGPDGGRLYVALDGRPVPGLPLMSGRSYLSLRDSRTMDSEIPLAAGLVPGPHRLEVVAASDGDEVAISGVIVARDRPFGWSYLWLHSAALMTLALVARAGLRLLLTAGRYLPVFVTRPGAR